MDVVRGAVGCAVVALLAGHQLSSLDAGRRVALWNAAREAVGAKAPASASPPLSPSVLDTTTAPATASQALGEERVPADPLGQFQTSVEIDGQRLSALVDTGATFVSLSAEDADRIGLRPAPSDYRYAVNTANGSARVAKVRLASVRLGGIELRDVAALVSGRGQLGQTLLGMSFLSRLSTVRIDRGRLILAR